MGLVGAAMAIIGCVLPWANVSAGFFSISIDGLTTPDGKIAIALAIGAGVLVLCKTTITDWTAAASFLGVLGIALVDIVRFHKTAEMAIMQPGVGLYLVAAGGAAGILGALLAIGDRRSP